MAPDPSPSGSLQPLGPPTVFTTLVTLNLFDNPDKEELFHLLSKQVVHIQSDERRFTAHVMIRSIQTPSIIYQILCRVHTKKMTLGLCFTHDSSMSGYTRIMICTIDKDVLGLAFSIYHTIEVNKLQVAFGV